MTFPRYSGAARADEEIEIGPTVRLQNMIDVKFLISTACHGRRRRPSSPALAQLLSGHTEFQFARFDVELNLVVVAHQSQRPTGRRFWSHVQHDGSVRGPAHACIGDADN